MRTAAWSARRTDQARCGVTGPDLDEGSALGGKQLPVASELRSGRLVEIVDGPDMDLLDAGAAHPAQAGRVPDQPLVGG